MGQTVYGYELYIGKTLSLGLSVSKVEILADGALVKTYEGTELSQCLIKKVDPFSAEEALFTGRNYSVLFAWPALNASAPVPSQFSHRVFFSDGKVAEGGSVAVTAGTTLIAPPVKGDRWWAANGTSNFDRHHRTSIMEFFYKPMICPALCDGLAAVRPRRTHWHGGRHALQRLLLLRGGPPRGGRRDRDRSPGRDSRGRTPE